MLRDSQGAGTETPRAGTSRNGAAVHVESRPTALSIQGLHKIYGRAVHALRGVDLAIGEGEFVTLLGPSGSGKTTLLMVVAGFESPTHGTILARGVEITALSPERRNFGVVFQSYALFPHLSVRSNIGYPLAARGVRRKQRQALVAEALSLVGLEGLGERRPAQLSGGQQQRVALARALVYRPSILLLDEPLGALDRALRERMQVELRSLHSKLGVTILYVTHDQDEALAMSDRVVVMRDGRIEQIGTPEDVYARPTTEFVATFVGTANLLGHVESGRLVVVRPEKVRIETATAGNRPGEAGMDGRVEREVFAGSVWRYYVSTSAGEFQVHSPTRARVDLGHLVRLCWDVSDGWIVPRREGIETPPAGSESRRSST